MRFSLYDRWGAYLRDLDGVLSASWAQEINGEDSLELEVLGDLSKGHRIVWRDATGTWHEHVVSSVDDTHDSDGPPTSKAWCELSTCELRGDYVVDKRPGVSSGGTSAREAMEAALGGTRWSVGTVDVSRRASASLYHQSAWRSVWARAPSHGRSRSAAYGLLS